MLLSATNALLLFVLSTFVAAAALKSKPKSDGPTSVPELTPLIDAAIDVAHGTADILFPYIIILKFYLAESGPHFSSPGQGIMH